MNYTIATSRIWTENNNQRHLCQLKRRLNHQQPKPKRALSNLLKRQCHKPTQGLKPQETSRQSSSKSCRSTR